MIISSICTGCGACMSICPKGCISMVETRLSELRPHINKDLCIGCSLCVNTCPENKPLEKLIPKNSYVAWSREDNDLVYSASGGVAAVFARYQLETGSIAVGCDYDSTVHLSHFFLNNEEDVCRAQSSKYSQSNAYEVFPQVKSSLDSDIAVVFIGTPCQVAGLRKYLVKDYLNLITVDLVCHGTPPNRYLQRYLRESKIETPIDRVRFRGEFDQKLTVWKKGHIIFQEKSQDNLYFSAFYSNKISMESCYNCRYASPKRVSDITIADYWGLGELHSINKRSDRPSLVLINTNKGEEFFKKVSDKLVYEGRSVSEAIQGNGRLNVPPGKSAEAILFRIIYFISSHFSISVKLSEKLSRICENRVDIALKNCLNRFKRIIKRCIEHISR